MARRQVKCIRQDSWRERHEKITHIGGDWGIGGTRMVITEAEAIRDLTPPVDNTYFVRDTYGDEAEVQVVTHHNGKKYLRTHRDSTTKDNLLSLPPCA